MKYETTQFYLMLAIFLSAFTHPLNPWFGVIAMVAAIISIAMYFWRHRVRIED